MRTYFYALILASFSCFAWLAWPFLAPVMEPGLPPLNTVLIDVPLTAQRQNTLGYERENFGSGWGSIGACDSRDAVMVRHFGGHDCIANPGKVFDVYTGDVMSSNDVEIDHVVPLSAAWDLGAHRWDAPTRRQFANDPRNLVAVSSSVNQEKSDQLPASWLPPNRKARCWYVRRIALVARDYRLPLPEEDVKVMRRQCPGMLLRLPEVDLNTPRPRPRWVFLSIRLALRQKVGCHHSPSHC